VLQVYPILYLDQRVLAPTSWSQSLWTKEPSAVASCGVQSKNTMQSTIKHFMGKYFMGLPFLPLYGLVFIVQFHIGCAVSGPFHLSYDYKDHAKS
jgi:hypothetical protein